LSENQAQKSMAAKPSPTLEEVGGIQPWLAAGVSRSSTIREEICNAKEFSLMEAVVEKNNMHKALAQVRNNGGSAGVDKMTTEELPKYLTKEWLRIKGELLLGQYKPKAVRVVEIPKPAGGMRRLGIPTAVDRLIQQALQQILTPIFDPNFSESSFGFRPKRSAHQAVLQAQKYVQEGLGIVVDIDLEKFFDRVNHDMLMARVARKVKDKRVLRLIRGYLQAGMMNEGLVSARIEGTPQGGPLSPLLSNILLDDLDKELENRGHHFCRYADDCNIYVRTEQSGERVMKSVTKFLEVRLKLKVNQEKSQVSRPSQRKFLGYSVVAGKAAKLKPAASSVKRFKGKLRALFREGRGQNLGRFIVDRLNPVLRGWINYFKLSLVKAIFEELDGWIRRKLRCLLWRQWKQAKTRCQRLQSRGLDKERSLKSANNGRGAWWNSGASHMNKAYPKQYFDMLKLVSLLDKRKKFELCGS
jgi:RNA-directed DNA polymerase